MSLQTRIRDAFIRVGTEFKAIRTLVSGSGTGDASGLNTTASNLVAAINEVKTTADQAAGGGVTLAQVQSEVNTAVNALLDGAPAALDTLNELAAAINDDATFSATITAAVAAKANSADVYTQAQIGNVDPDLVATFEAALA